MRRTARLSSTAITTALIYTRVSGDEQEREGLSLPAQLADCRRYAAAHGWIIGGEFQDVMSGKRDDRPQYRALLADVRRVRTEGHGVTVVVKWLHRFGRRVLERARSWEELDSLGVQVHSVAEGGQVPKLVADVLAAVAEEESRQIGERVSSTWKHVTAQGWAKTTTAPWGYRWRPATAEERAGGSPKSVLDVQPECAPFVSEAFQKVASGEPGRAVGRWAAGLPDAARGGRRMSWRTMQDILHRPVYAGRPLQGAPDVLTRPIARWPALVTDDVWQAVQQRIDGHQRMAHQASGRYLLTGLLRCRACGGRMRGEASPNALRYRCGSDDRCTRCTQSVDKGRVERLVLDELGAVLNGIVEDPRVQDGLKRAWQARQAPDDKDTGKQVQRLENQIQRARQRITRATELLVDGTIERQAYDDLVAKARADADAAETELAAVSRSHQLSQVKLPPIDQVLAIAGGWANVLDGADVDAQREVLSVLVARIVAVRERPGVYRVELLWTPLGEALITAKQNVQ